MSNGSSGSAINAALEFIAGAISSSGKTRKDLLASASQMASAIQMASAVCTSRFASALAANTVTEKRQILAKVMSDEILQMGHVNKLCDPIAASANQLDHALSAEWANVNLGAHGLAGHAFLKLQDREWGLSSCSTRQSSRRSRTLSSATGSERRFASCRRLARRGPLQSAR